MPMFPLFIDLKGKSCVVAGGGRVAERKTGILLEFGARITVVSPDFTPGLQKLGEEGRLCLKRGYFSPQDMEGAFLVIAATSEESANSRIYEDAVARSIPVNVAHDPEKCTFLFPSIVRRGETVVGISTSGGFPALSKYIRKRIDKALPEEYGRVTELLAETRAAILAGAAKRPETGKQGGKAHGVDEQGTDEQDADGQSADRQGVGEQGPDRQSVDEQGSDSRGADGQGPDRQGVDEQSADRQSVDGQGSDSRGVDRQGTSELAMAGRDKTGEMENRATKAIEENKRRELIDKVLQAVLDCCDRGDMAEAGAEIYRILGESGYERHHPDRKP